MHLHLRFTYTLALLLLLPAGCDKPTEPGIDETSKQAEAAEPSEAAEQQDAKARAVAISSASIDLDAIAKLVIEQAETAESLEVMLNDPEQKLQSVDVDGDGEIDPIQVVELDAEGVVALELRAIPSSSKSVEDAVAIATLELVPVEAAGEVEVRAIWATEVQVEHDESTAVVASADVESEPSAAASAEVEGAADASAVASAEVVTTAHATAAVHVEVKPVVVYRVRAEYRAGVVVHASAPFVVWAFAVHRPLYYGVYVRDHRGVRIPPGHLKHGHWKATGSKPGRAHAGVRVAAGPKPHKAGGPKAGPKSKSVGGKPGKGGKPSKGGKPGKGGKGKR
jgi:hypothetical protein